MNEAYESELTTTIKARWEKLNSQRHSVLHRARECAKLTIPSLLPPEGATENTTLETPYQGIGARGTNTLASKLLIALLPPNSPFFRLQIDDFSLMELGPGNLRSEVEKALNRIERAVMTEVETRALRISVFEGFRHLIVTGNTLLFLPDEGGMKTYRLDQYVVKRDPMGNVMEIIIKEQVHPYTLPESIRDRVLASVKDAEKPVDLFTRVVRTESNRWEVIQECEEQIIPESQGSYPLDECPWIPLRWTSITGEDYGRGLVEEHLGDLLTLEALTKALVEGTVVSSKVIFLVSPNGTTRAAKIVNARSGDVIEGNSADVTTLQVDKYPDFRIAAETIQRIELRLSHVFMLMEGIQRDAERVTAEEVRRMAQELEDSLGGVYTVLSQEFQLPLVRRLMAQMTKAGRLPKLPKEVVQPSIVTGLEALGRGNDLNKLSAFLEVISPFANEILPYINARDFAVRVGTALGIDMDGLVLTEEEFQQKIMAQQMAMLAQNALPGMAQEITKGVMSASGGEGEEG